MTAVVGDVPRDEYTWAIATKDLALSTSLTLADANDLTYPLRFTDLHPFDMVLVVIRLLNGRRENSAEVGAAIFRLTTGRDWTPWTDTEAKP